MNLGKAVKAERTKRQWTQEYCANEIGIGLTTLRYLEENRFNTRIITLYAICAGFGITPSELFREAERYD